MKSFSFLIFHFHLDVGLPLLLLLLLFPFVPVFVKMGKITNQMISSADCGNYKKYASDARDRSWVGPRSQFWDLPLKPIVILSESVTHI